MKIVYNHQLLDSNSLPFLPDDRAFRYGDGLFETIIVQNAKPRLWQYHWERLNKGMHLLGMKPDKKFQESALLNQIPSLLAAQGISGNARLRLHVWRKEGGLYSPTDAAVNFLFRAEELGPTPTETIKAAFAESICLYPTPWSAFKTHNALPYILASQERQRRQLDDLILLDARSWVSEATYSNVFWKTKGTWYTPALSCGCLNGVMRRHLIDFLANKEGMVVREGEYPKSDLLRAEHILLSNARGLRWVSQLDSREFETTPTPEISRALTAIS